MLDLHEISKNPFLRLAKSSDDDEDDNKTLVLWTKIIFIILSFLEGFCFGAFPTWSKSCRESPKALGFANAFAAGVFLAIGFCHILPEQMEAWEFY